MLCQCYVFIFLIQKFSFIFFDPILTRVLAACSLYQLAIVWLQRKPVQQIDPRENEPSPQINSNVRCQVSELIDLPVVTADVQMQRKEMEYAGILKAL